MQALSIPSVRVATTRERLVIERITRQDGFVRYTDLMQAELEDELQGSIDQYFGDFDWKPIGTASIAQAYGATLVSGESVVVKIQRPGAEDLVDRDTKVLMNLARMIERRTPQGRELRVGEVAREFSSSLRRELDFSREAANAIDLAGATDPASGVRIPHVFDHLGTSRVLVEERFRGTSVAYHERIAELGLDETELADRLMRMMLAHMFTHGHFHADPHPGNVLYLPATEACPNGSIGLLDVGMVGRLDARLRERIERAVTAVMRRDATTITGMSNMLRWFAAITTDPACGTCWAPSTRSLA